MEDICMMCGHDPACGLAMIDGDRYCHDSEHSCYQQAQAEVLFNTVPVVS